MTKQDLQNAVAFLSRCVVYGDDVDILIATIDSLKREIDRRERKPKP
jgi:hypothetical protein